MKKRPAKKTAVVASVASVPSPRGQTITDFGHMFEAARRDGYRGWFYFPTLEPNEQMPRDTRQAVAEKAWWLYNNVDVVRAVIDGLSLDEVDTGIWPKATTDNPDFNREVTETFHEECGRSATFHAADHANFYSAQFLIRRSISLMGELFGQMLEPSPDNPLPACHFLNSWKVGNAVTPMDQKRWDDGIYSNRLGRPLQYRFLLNRERTQWLDVSRDSVLHFHDYFWEGQKRGMSGLAPVTKKLFSLNDIEKAETAGTLLRARMAYAIERREDDGSGPQLLPGVVATETVTNDDGSKLLIQKVVLQDGNEVDVARPPVGSSLKVVESNRSSTTPEFLRWLLTGIAAARLYPAEYVFGLAGLTNGTTVRMVQKRVQRVKNTVRQFQLAEQFVTDWYVFWIYQRLKAGRFDGIPGGIPKNWFRHKLIFPGDDTVDLGREGRLYDERLSRGYMSPETYHGMQGEDAEDVEDEVIARAIRIKKKIKKANEELAADGIILVEDEIFRPPTGGGGNNTAPEPDPNETVDPNAPPPGKTTANGLNGRVGHVSNPALHRA